MLFCIGDISLSNLPVGTVRITELSGVDAADRLRSAEEAGALIGLFEFGPVPNPDLEDRFMNILAALSSEYDLTISPRAFFSRPHDADESMTAANLAAEPKRDAHSAPHGPVNAPDRDISDLPRSFVLPNPPGLFEITRERPMIVMSYFLTLDRPLDLLSLKRAGISPGSMRFHLIEQI